MGKAHWIQHNHLFRADEYECSACNALFDKPYVICPNCCDQMGGWVKYDASWVDEMAEYDDMFGDDDNDDD